MNWTHLLFLTGLAACNTAIAQQYGSWNVDVSSYSKSSSDSLYAMTVNDSGNGFGQFCYPDSDTCIWIVATQTSCKKDKQYPVLASSEAGASSMEVYCDGEFKKGHFRYVFMDFDKMDEMVRGGTRLGIVLPLAAGEFKAVRFELTGATTAIDTMLKSATSSTAKDKRGTRDVKL